ncbi:Endogenous Retrovirus Group K Member 18 Pol Protein, partial [Manis pentadactyla]
MALPKDWKSIVIDIKDCFFSIPLHSEDCKKFAFTVPAINHDCPDERYEWKVLPQGMANSPTMCQLYVHEALAE